MNHTKSQFLIEQILKNEMQSSSRVIERRGRQMRELSGVSFTLYHQRLEFFNSYRESEYQQYREMIQSQISRFKNYLNIDKFSRRLLIQFPADWYENTPQDYMPCPESFIVLYLNENEYEIIANFRSTEISRLSEDIAMIKSLCIKELGLVDKLIKMKIHLMNVHKYLDQGSSEDFDVVSGYYNRKNK